MAIQAYTDTDSNSLTLRPPVPLVPFPPFEDELPPPPRPFQPGPPVDTSDLMAQINALLQPNTPAPQPMGIGGVLKALLAGLPQAVAVGLSKDPAAALNEQLKEMRAMQFQREQQAQARKDRLEDLRRTVGIDLARGEIEQRRQVGREQRQYGQQVALVQQEQAFRRGERQEEAESRFQMAQLEQRGREALQQAAFENAKTLADQNYERDVLLKATQDAAKFAALGMKGEMAYDIAKRALKGELTAADKKAINEVYSREFAELQLERKLGRRLTQAQINKLNSEAARDRAAASGGGGAGLHGEMMKVFFKGLEDAVKTPMVVLANGTVTERATLSDADKMTVQKTLTQEENIQRFMNGPGKLLLSGLAKGFNQTTSVTGPAKALIAQQLDAQINQFKKIKASDDAIVKGLVEYGKASGNQEDVIDAIIRNKLEGSAAKNAIREDTFRMTSGAKVGQAPKAPVKVDSIIPGQGPISRGLRFIEQKMAELDAKIEELSKPNPPPGFDPRTRRPVGESLAPAPSAAPQALGILPDFDPSIIRRMIDRFDFPLKVPDHYADDLNPGAVGRYIERLMGVPTEEDAKDFRKEMQALEEATKKRKGEQKAKNK